MSREDKLWEEFIDEYDGNQRPSGDKLDKLIAILSELKAVQEDQPTLGIDAFFDQVSSGLVEAQENLDRKTRLYNNNPDTVLKSMFHIPKVNAEFKFETSAMTSKGFNIIVAGAKEKENRSEWHKINFDIVSAPAPPEVLRNPNILFSTNELINLPRPFNQLIDFFLTINSFQVDFIDDTRERADIEAEIKSDTNDSFDKKARTAALEIFKKTSILKLNNLKILSTIITTENNQQKLWVYWFDPDAKIFTNTQFTEGITPVPNALRPLFELILYRWINRTEEDGN